MRLEEAIDKHGNAVYRLARAMLPNLHDADDAFQDVFLRYVERAPAFRDDDHRRAWLLRVTINRCRSHYRSPWWKRITPLEEAALVPALPPEDPALDTALARLPQEARTIIHLYYFEKYGTEDIAKLCGIRPVSVRSRLSRARKQLEALLKEDDADV